MESISCKNCGGQMRVINKSRYSQGVGFFLLILGIISIFFIFGLPFGILMVVIGIYMCSAKESVWLCESCKIAIPRVEVYY